MSFTVCIIPARGGSKRIPRKNIRPFCGRPIICHVIEAALASGCFDEVMVSTDDEEIAAVARAAGAAVPFMRSAKASDDQTDTMSVIIEVIETYKALGKEIQMGCCIYPVAALATPAAIRSGFERLISEPELSYVFPVVNFGHPIQRAMYLKDGRVGMFQPEAYLARSQDLPAAYHDAGQWYWFRSEPWLKRIPVFGPQAAAIVISELEAQDIDNETDWRLAEMKHEFRQRLKETVPA